MVVRYSGVAPPSRIPIEIYLAQSVTPLNIATFLLKYLKFLALLPFSWLLAMRPLTNISKYIYIFMHMCAL